VIYTCWSTARISPSLPRSGGEGRGEEVLSNRHKKPLSPALSPLRRAREKIPNLAVGWLNSMAVLFGSLPARPSQGKREFDFSG